MSFTGEDLKMLRSLKSVIHAGDFSIKGDAVTGVASLFNWLNGLDEKIQANIKSKPLIPAGPPKPIRNQK